MSVGQVFPQQYSSQLAAKVSEVNQLLSEFSPPKPEVFTSAPEHYRLRAEFRIWHDGDDIYHAMFDPETKAKIRIDYFPVACRTIADFMPILLQQLQFNHELRYKLYQIDYLATLSGELLVSLIYKKSLDDTWLIHARQLTELLAPNYKVKFIGRARKQKLMVSDDFVIEQFDLLGKTLRYQQIESSFTQPNGGVNVQMLTWAKRVATELKGDLLELYCGNGNFSIALASDFNQVVATEISRTSIKSAEYNIALNNIDNLKVLQISAEDVATALQQGTSLKKLDLSDLKLNTILVDPPRAGLDAATERLVAGFNDIIYISCNPHTLAHNLATLCQSHDIVRFAVFDQFPYTTHIETGVWLRKR
ncbi:tRNA (uridine(54)-C5)-methyltransferase TrmA [Rheinheimera sp. MMS21-TC3]|uniref:tRNA (uridine(54)-C5)-methyltransferase TrmA n=1 Tax=Rheinheimera sp. MMS21-TC3 TaxID=3072790 RepID=UPI0028C3DF1C|nr:tRNA (uridine(54)-C5)-methyltransferase TrmA [Rheinheimera sp. MMS21-TC3]WNO59859.1 tRNA (uridine(54)-C5)-methyltransferase TrmA [Rheinheimera sp. MMS21-TC3]